MLCFFLVYAPGYTFHWRISALAGGKKKRGGVVREADPLYSVVVVVFLLYGCVLCMKVGVYGYVL